MSIEIRKAANARQSFDTVVAKFQRRLYLYAFQMLHCHEDAEDVVQDAFIRAYRAYQKMEAEPLHDARLSAWLFKITLNVVRNRLRKMQPEQLNIEPENHLTPSTLVDRHATFVLVERAIRKLPSCLVRAARLRFIDGLTHPQIAERCSLPEGTIKSHVFRAKRLLRAALSPAFA